MPPYARPHLAVLLLLCAGPLWAAATAEKPAPPIDFSAVISHAKEEIFPKTVYIKVVLESFEQGKKVRQQATGSGVVISSDGYVVTNYHVVDKAVGVRCILQQTKQYEADVIGRDQEADLALLKLKMPAGAPALPAATFGDSRALHEGDFVMAMGCPFGLRRSVSFGVVSNPDQYLEGYSEYNNWLQTDASINPGNSGGPLVNIHGEVVGINTLGLGGTGLGFAIPSETVQRVVKSLREKGRMERVWSGIQFQALKDFERNTMVDSDDGVLVGGIDPDSPAQESGLKVGDLIISLDGQPVGGRFVEDLPEVRRRFAALPAGVPALLDLRRDGAPLQVKLTPHLKGAVEGENFDCEEWMMTLKEINQFEDPWSYYMRKKGSYVLGVKKDANASRSGLITGDILVKMDGREILSLEDAKSVYETSIERPSGERKILVEVLRKGLPMKLVLDFTRTKASYEAEK